MSDDIVVEEEEESGVPDLAFQEYMNDLEVVVGKQEEKEEETGPTKEELIQQLESMKTSLELTKQQVDLVGAIKEMGQQRQEPVQQVSQEKVETEEELMERINEGWVDNPYNMLMEFNKKKVAPMAQELMATNVFHSKKDLERDPERTETYKQYQGEIEEEVKKIAPMILLKDPEIYTKVHDRVIAGHVQEIIQQRVDAAVSGKEILPAKTELPISHTESSTVNPGQTGAKKVVHLTPQEAEQAAMIGLSQKEYYLSLKRKGLK